MSDSVALAIAVVSSLPATLAAIFGYLGHRQNKEIIKATNGMKTELVAATKVASHAEGMMDQMAETKAEAKSDKSKLG